LDLKGVQGGFETRIAYLSRVPAVVLSIAEGMQGSSLNAGNYAQARRNFADSWVYPTLQDICASLATIVDVPSDAELWFDTSDMPFLREDEKDAAEIEQIRASTIRQLIDGGFTPESAIRAVVTEDMSVLQHTGMLSVQLQPPGTGDANEPAAEEPAATGGQ
ncbi:MAG: phage portal protein, partial [Acidimicrobiia bacterium]